LLPANRKFRTIIVTNLSAALFIGCLLFQDSHQWPEIILLLPLVAMVNIAVIRGRPFRTKPSKPSILLPVSYALGFIIIILCMIEDFHWWEILLLFIPAGFLALSIRNYRVRSSRLGAE
jgi:hypothetical protein